MVQFKWMKTVQVGIVLGRIVFVVVDWRFDNLGGSHFQSQKKCDRNETEVSAPLNVQLYTCGLPALPVICNIWDSAYSSKTPLTYCIVDLMITRWAGRFTWRKGDKLFISVNAYTIAMKPTIIRITNALDKYLVKWQYTTFFDQSFEFEYFTWVGF